MCRPGNQTIYRECLEKLREMGAGTNQEMHDILKKHDGCMKLDKKKELVLN